jgi:hypothetical protein
MWLGANDIQYEGTFIWESSNVPFSFVKWNQDQPDATIDQNCLVYSTSAGWDDAGCVMPSVATLCETLFACN